jgi:hypothetical protein
MKINRPALEKASRDVMGYLLHVLGKNVGLAVFVFEFGTGKNLAYVSNAKRADMIAGVKEWLARVESGLDTDPPGPRAQS